MKDKILFKVLKKLLTEANKSQIQELQSQLSEEDYLKFFHGENIIRPFKNDDYFFIFKNTINAGLDKSEGYDIDFFIRFFPKYQSIKTAYDLLRRQKKSVKAEDIMGNTKDITGKLDPMAVKFSTTIKDIVEYDEIKSANSSLSSNGINDILSKLQYEEGSENNYFKVVINNDKFIICKIKNIIGSIAIARSYWDGEKLVYDHFTSETGKSAFGNTVGEMNWCTSTISSNNEYVYYLTEGVEMFYCTKKDMNKEDKNRKLIIGFQYDDDTNSIKPADSDLQINVDAINKRNIEHDEMISIIGISNYKKLIESIDIEKLNEIDKQAKEAFSTRNRDKQEKYAKNKSDKVRAYLTKNANLYDTAIDILVYDKNLYIKEILALNGNLTSTQLMKLAETNQYSVLEKIRRHQMYFSDRTLRNDVDERIKKITSERQDRRV